ncbi:hypothetical protein [Fodinibius sediminis]|uniref:Iron-sulfur cluster repair protein YtfE, RIC family, contains ScdAN and hemerythrin domains n=1 Tax=Fodinibius sediminis TaxID=1214077 RepID=A0A521BKY6_9BACT|nr:hypothetical protein [Fodinibius sediminis]SMO47818.1 hypothetical protein SAMN06265218_103203 [Fodinibius sediminis]
MNSSPLTKLSPDAKLSQIMSANHCAAELLRSIGLRPSNHSNETLRSICRQRQWNEVEVLQWIKKKSHSGENCNEFAEQQEPHYGNDLLKWCNYVSDTLHVPTTSLLQEISGRFPKFSTGGVNQYPRLEEMQRYFTNFSEDLQLYMKFEQLKLFPLARRVSQSDAHILDGTIRQLQRGVQIISSDQKRLSRLLDTVAEQGHHFHTPPDTSSAHSILYKTLLTLKSQLNKQFKVEKEHIIPLIHRSLRTL